MRTLLAVAARRRWRRSPRRPSAPPTRSATSRTNRYAEVVASGNRVYVRYVLDLAEIPTVPGPPTVERLGRRRYAAGSPTQHRARTSRSRSTASARPLRALGRALRFPPGAAGLRTTRLEVVYDAGAARGGPRSAFATRDDDFADRLGWREVVVTHDPAARGSPASTAPAHERHRRAARATRRTCCAARSTSARRTAPCRPGARPEPPPRIVGATRRPRADRRRERGETGFASLIQEDDLSAGVVLVSLLARALLGRRACAHARATARRSSPRTWSGRAGRPRHASLLGGIVTSRTRSASSRSGS